MVAGTLLSGTLLILLLTSSALTIAITRLPKRRRR